LLHDYFIANPKFTSEVYVGALGDGRERERGGEGGEWGRGRDRRMSGSADVASKNKTWFEHSVFT
jgi:hypothetical protein